MSNTTVHYATSRNAQPTTSTEAKATTAQRRPRDAALRPDKINDEHLQR